MSSKRKELLDDILGNCQMLANDAPDNYPEFYLKIGINMDSNFARIEENITELRGILKKDMDVLEIIASKIQQSKAYYYSGQYEQGENILWEIYNDERVMKLK